ncbi:hypothetical protein TWF132_008087 [Orbilia oligospora]|nr:hypothetical protein TWF132_008087 [Orbilia oligospora]
MLCRAMGIKLVRQYQVIGQENYRAYAKDLRYNQRIGVNTKDPGQGPANAMPSKPNKAKDRNQQDLCTNKLVLLGLERVEEKASRKLGGSPRQRLMHGRYLYWSIRSQTYLLLSYHNFARQSTTRVVRYSKDVYGGTTYNAMLFCNVVTSATSPNDIAKITRSHVVLKRVVYIL